MTPAPGPVAGAKAMKIHAEHPTDARYSLCGLVWWRPEDPRRAAKPEEATCRTCLGLSKKRCGHCIGLGRRWRDPCPH